jgi:hypothetical protein
MLFAALVKVKPNVQGRRLTRRVVWKYPPGIKKVAEYWLPTPDIRCIVILEATSAPAIMEAYYQWSDVYDITVVPTITEEEGVHIAKHFPED